MAKTNIGASMESGIVAVFSHLSDIGVRGPMKMRFRGQKVYAAVKAVAKTPQIAIASFMGSSMVELKSVEKRAISA